MNKNNNAGSRRNWPRTFFRNLLIGGLLLNSVSLSAQELEKEKLVAVLNVINMYLMDGLLPPIPTPAGAGEKIALSDGSGGPLVLGQDPVNVSDSHYFEFDLQEVGIELCFFIYSATPISDGGLTVEINGKAQPAQFGENCFKVGRGQQREVNYVQLIVNQSGLSVSLSMIELSDSNPTQLQLPRLTRGEWDERAVRKVLKIFAFGGHATDDQIFLWAAMRPADAIVEMLNFAEHNPMLSPLAANEPFFESASQNGKLWDWQEWMRSEASNLPIPVGSRDQYGLDGYNFDDAYGRMITVRGMNPFRQRIGFWETNYHLAVNREVGVSRREVAAYYDLIMEAHEAGLPYYRVMGAAAKSAAIAEQYGHDRNQWRYDRDLDDYFCACNDDFAREIHQLFFGIFGADDPDHHESVTIPNTAKMLTDMPVNGSDSSPEEVRVNFGAGQHYNFNGDEPPLSILKNTIPHSTTADQKIDYLMPISMQHPESLHNLPIMIISVLADDNLSEYAKTQLRNSWASMGVERVLLDFLQAYAVSDLFHGANQFKYLTSHERALYIANKHNQDNLEAYFGGGYYRWAPELPNENAGRTVGSIISEDNANEFFEPLHNVFGGQTSTEASDSALAFENHYNRLTDREGDLRGAVDCNSCDQGDPWEKRWREVLPARADGNIYVSDAAEWLWNHVVGNTDNYTELERAHLIALLGAARIDPTSSGDEDHVYDLNLLMCVIEDYKVQEGVSSFHANGNTITDVLTGGSRDDYCRDSSGNYEAHELAELNAAYTGQQLADNAELQTVLNTLGNRVLRLNDPSATVRVHNLERVSYALNFIFTTPFVFAEGR